MLEATRPDAVGAFFVFLHLLKRKAQSVCKLLLGHSLHLTPHSYTIAHVPVGRVW
jgi:hypothetical protein